MAGITALRLDQRNDLSHNEAMCGLRARNTSGNGSAGKLFLIDSERELSHRIGLICCILLQVVLLAACGLKISEEEHAAAYDLIERNLYYASIEDVNGYLGTLDPESPVYNETQTQMPFLFGELDLTYDIEAWEILSIDRETARIRVVQVTRKIESSEPFRDNRLEVIHSLRKNGEGEWKIYASDFIEGSLEYLDALAP
jgi:hypothetical protein